jgi:hypothetical protein
MVWTAFEPAVSGQGDAAGALGALSSMREVHEMLDRIGAGKGGQLLMGALAAEPGSQARMSKLTEALEVIDDHLPASGARKTSILRRRYAGASPVPNGDAVGCAVMAALIDSVLGGDPERLRNRMASAATWFESALAADLNRFTERDRGAETSAGRRALHAVFQLLLKDVQSR